MNSRTGPPVQVAPEERLMVEDAARSGLTGRDLDQLGFAVLSPERMEELTDGSIVRRTGYKIPYFAADGTELSFFRVKLTGDSSLDGFRYRQPKNSGVEAYLPPLSIIDWTKVAKDAGTRLVFTEGEKKAVWACKRGIITVGLGGVGNYKSSKQGKTLPDAIGQFAFEGRKVEIAHDGDKATNANVRRDEQGLAAELVARGCDVCIVDLPLGVKLDELPDRAAYEALPRRPFDAKTQVSLVRLAKLPARAKRERISAIVKRAFIDGGEFYKTDDKSLAYFDREHAHLLSLDSDDDIELHAVTNQRYGLNASEAEFQFVFKDLEAHGFTYGKPSQLHYFAHFNEQTRTVYLNAGSDRVFRVTEKGYTVVPNGTDGVIFRPLKIDEIKPDTTAKRAALDSWLDVPNFQDGRQLTREQKRLLLETWFWTLLFAELHPTRAILVLTGPLGSCKSAALRYLGRLLFNSEWDTSTFNPDKPKDLVTSLTNQPLVAFDNADGVAANGIENLLATSATGGKVAMAELYKTNKNVEFKLVAHIAVASRDPNCFSRSDIVSRLLLLPVETRDQYEAESSVQKRFQKLRPAFWGYLLKTLPAIIKATRTRKQLQNTRLADFAQFAMAIAPAIGSTSEKMQLALQAVDAERNAFSLAYSVLPAAIDEWMDVSKNVPAETSSGDLFKAIRALRGNFPYKTAQSFGLKLSESLPALRQEFNITIRTGKGGAKLYTIRRRKEQK